MERKNGNQPEGFQPGGALAREMRFAMASSYNAESRTVEGVFAAGSPVRRFGFIETLNMDAGAVDLSRVGQGQCKVLDSHNSYEIDAILGVVETASIVNGQLVGRIRFADTEAGRKAEGMVARGELTGFSIGYSIQKWTNVSQEDTGVETWRADQWSLLEVTLCAVPADPASTVRAVTQMGDLPGIPENEDDMTRSAQPAAAAAAAEPNPPVEAVEIRATPASEPAAPVETRAAPGLTPSAALQLARQADVLGQRELAEQMIGEGATEAEIRAAVMAAHANISRANAATTPRVEVTRDEGETRRRGIEDALANQLGEGGQPSEFGRSFMGVRSIWGMAAEYLGHRGRVEGFGAKEDLLRRAMGPHSTSDFPILLDNALNRALRARYEAAQPAYRAIAAQRTYNDFRPHVSVRVGDFPQLKEIKEGGEIEAGTFSEAKEYTAPKSFGRKVSFSRQLLINDNLGGIQQMLNDRGSAIARLEDDVFFTMMLSASGAGPTLNETARAVFNTTDKTLASSGAAIDVSTLGAGRAAMRKKTSIDGVKLNVSPAILLVGPDYENIALMYTSSQFVPNQASVVNPFSGVLRVVVTSQIATNAWYLFADPSVGANFEWGLLDGYSAPRMRIDEPFGYQGISVSLEHDFGCGAIDYRYGYRNAGA